MVWANVLSMRTKSETMPQMISLWLAPLYGDADAQLYSQWHSDSCGRGNYSFYKNPKVDDLLERARRSNDPKARAGSPGRRRSGSSSRTRVDIFTAIEKATYVWRNEREGLRPHAAARAQPALRGDVAASRPSAPAACSSSTSDDAWR